MTSAPHHYQDGVNRRLMEALTDLTRFNALVRDGSAACKGDIHDVAVASERLQLALFRAAVAVLNYSQGMLNLRAAELEAAALAVHADQAGAPHRALAE